MKNKEIKLSEIKKHSPSLYQKVIDGDVKLQQAYNEVMGSITSTKEYKGRGTKGQNKIGLSKEVDRLFKDNSRKEIECELLDKTDKSIKIKYGIHTTYLPKKIITFMRVNEGSIIKVRLPLWLYRKKFN